MLAGQIIRAADFDGYSSVSDTTDETNFNTLTFDSGGTPVGLTFRAPTSGIVVAHWACHARLNNATAVRLLIGLDIREGSTIGSGISFDLISDDDCIGVGEAAGTRLAMGMSRPITGLTPGSMYNVVMMWRNTVSVASAGSIFFRAIHTVPVV